MTPAPNIGDKYRSSRPYIDLIFFDAGGGHRAAANALNSVLKQQGKDWDVRLVNLQELLDPLDVFRKITGIRLQDLYNRMLNKGWTLGSAQLLRGVQMVISLNHGPAVRLLARHWEQTRPDMLVSLVPNLNRVMYDAFRKARPNAPYVSILTDFADYPPHFWIERDQRQYFICGTDRAVAQAGELGHPRERIFRASGMIMRPTFHEPVELDRAAERKRLGLDPDRPAAIVMFGGQGSRVMLDIAARLGRSGLPLQLIMICGRNEALASRLRAMRLAVPMHVEGFTQEIPYFMSLADFFIGKPGPGSISEAIAMRLPVIVERNSWTLPQERYNDEWVLENRVGFVVGNFREAVDAVRPLLEPATLAAYRANAAAIRNRAVFEIPDILERLLTITSC